MFKRFDEDWPPPRWEPETPREPERGGRPAVSRRDEAVLLWLVGASLFGVLIAPMAGGTVLGLVAMLWE